VPFKNNSKLKKLIEEHDIKKTKLTEWFTTNQKNPKGLELTYCEFPSKLLGFKNTVHGKKGNTGIK